MKGEDRRENKWGRERGQSERNEQIEIMGREGGWKSQDRRLRKEVENRGEIKGRKEREGEIKVHRGETGG